MEDLIYQLEREVEGLFHKESSGHDIYHLKRTLNNALKIQESEGGDELIIAVSAFLHDIHRILEKETDNFISPKESLPKVREILDKTGLSEEQKKKILHCIEHHEEYGFSKNGKTVDDIETLIVQDADNLDAMGAIGIGRTFMFHGARGGAMWIPEKPLQKEGYDESERDPSVIHHFYSKLLKLKEDMNTETARRMAEERHEFMKTFLREFFGEWKSEK